MMKIPSYIKLSAAKECMCTLSCSVVSDSLQPQGLWPSRFLCPWDSPGKNTRVGSHALFPRIFPTQGMNPGLLQADSLLSEPPGKSEQKKWAETVVNTSYASALKYETTCIKLLSRENSTAECDSEWLWKLDGSYVEIQFLFGADIWSYSKQFQRQVGNSHNIIINHVLIKKELSSTNLFNFTWVIYMLMKD